MNKINSKIISMSSENKKKKNISKNLTFSKNKNDNNNQTCIEHTIKKNKIINIRIYQNYTTDKNTNTIFNQCTNNFINNINIPLKITNEIGTQTIKVKEPKNIIKQKNLNKNNENINRNSTNKIINKKLQNSENKYNFSKTFSTSFKNKNIIKNDNKIIRKKKSVNFFKNNSYFINYKRKKIINLKDNIPNKKVFEVNEDLNNSKNNKINHDTNNINYMDNEKNDEKNKIAKKYSLFNLKNDNKYLIINDGNYDSNYHENSKLSINNIYTRRMNKNDTDNENFLFINSLTPTERKINNYLLCDKNQNDYNDFFSKMVKNKNINDNSKFIGENYKPKVINDINEEEKNNIKEKNKYYELSITKCNDLLINQTKKNNNINEVKNTNETGNINIVNNYYSQFISRIQNSVNKFLFEYDKNKKSDNNIIINDSNNLDKKIIINDISKTSFKIIPDKIKEEMKEKKHIDKEKNKINQIVENKIKNKENNNIKKIQKTVIQKNLNDKKKNNNLILNDNKKINKKYESFLHNEITQEDENGIKFEDLLQIYTEDTIKGNQSIEEINNKIVGDEQTFFNNSKIPKVQECNNYQEKLKENDNNINNQMKIQNKNKIYEKINIRNKIDKIRSNKIETKEDPNFFKLFKTQKNNNKEDYEQFEKLFNSNTCKNKNNYCLFNIDKEYQKSLNKERMYNFLFNETANSTNCKKKNFILNLFDNRNNGINTVDSIIKKLNSDINSYTYTQFYRQNNSSRPEFSNYNKRNKSYKDSYSKFYLNKLDIENKLLIPQLSKRNEDFFDCKFFNINIFK